MNYSTTINPESEYGITAAREAYNANISTEIEITPAVPASDGVEVVPAVMGPNPAYLMHDSAYLDFVLKNAVESWCKQYAPVVVAPVPDVTVGGVPQEVTMRQARLALFGAGLLTQVNAAIAASGSDAAKIEWEYGNSVLRNNGLVPQLAAQLGMTEVQIDQLFITAAKL